MPDILIRGMEMPTEQRVEVLIFKNGYVAYYDVDGRYLGQAKATPLPEGHGDLIDRKRLHLVPDYKCVRNGIKHIIKETKRDGRVIAGISIELLEQTLVALDELRSVRRYFENARTIVPAERGM
jgi:hypothetical protein